MTDGPDDPTDEPTDEPMSLAAARTAGESSGPRLLFTFGGPGKVDMNLDGLTTVTIGQLMAAAYFLDCVAREMRQSQLVQAAQQRGLVVPTPGDLAAAMRRRQ